MFAVKTILAVVAILASTAAFHVVPSYIIRAATSSSFKRSSLSMMWDTQKVGRKSIVETTIPKTQEEEAISTMFRRVPPGSGMDERSPTVISDELLEIESATISRIDRSFRQNSLKMALEGDFIGSAEKLNRIHLATASGILPDTMIAGSSKVASLSAGGLFKDWDADM
jgi:hypothetical protein